MFQQLLLVTAVVIINYYAGKTFDMSFVCIAISIMWDILKPCIFVIAFLMHNGYSNIDSATHEENRFAVGLRDGRTMPLVMSDEFEVANRDFRKGHDKLFEAIEKPDHTNEAIQFCKLKFSFTEITWQYDLCNKCLPISNNR